MSTKRVLIVDDDETTRESLALLLKSDAVEIHLAATEKEAERELSHEAFDLVITDLHLTGRLGTEGLDIISKIKTRTPETHVVLFTAFGSPEIEREALTRGATDYWEKTIQIPTMVEKIKALGIPAGRSKRHWPNNST
jgi:two-component system response regulator PilR (NtrC family)